MARRLRYGVAVSLDGFIARPNGAYDWIVMDPAIDFAAMAREYDTAVMGRKTWEAIRSLGDESGLSGIPILPPGAETKLVLSDQKVLPGSGIVALAYVVPGGIGPAPRIGYVRPGPA